LYLDNKLKSYNNIVTNIIHIGKSKWIILHSEVLKQLRLSLKSAVSISLDGNNIVIKAQPRQGWAEAAKRAHENGDDELLIPDVFEDEKFEDWTW
jgi:antitoxin MazE